MLLRPVYRFVHSHKFATIVAGPFLIYFGYKIKLKYTKLVIC